MKKLFLFVVVIISFSCTGQTETAYDKVVEVMYNEFNYTYDSTSNVIPERKRIENDTSKFVHRTISSLPKNMSPLVLVDGKPIKMEDLKLKPADKIAEVKIMPADVKTSAIYGLRGSKGVINLILKE